MRRFVLPALLLAFSLAGFTALAQETDRLGPVERAPLPDAAVPIPIPDEPEGIELRILRKTPDGWKETVGEAIMRRGQWRPVLPFDEERAGKPDDETEALLARLAAIRGRIDRMMERLRRLRAVPRIERELRLIPERVRVLRIAPDRKRGPEKSEQENLRRLVIRRVESLVKRKLMRRQTEREPEPENK